MQRLRLTPGRRALVLRVLSGLTLLAGWTDLALGGITAAPLLIVVGYAVLVPAVILSWK